MEEQDRQGTPWLQWYDHDRDFSDVARSGLGELRKTRTTESPASAVGRRSAKENSAGRTWAAGRWRRIPDPTGERIRPARRTGLGARRQSPDHWAQRSVQGRAEPECSASVPKLLLHTRMPATLYRHRRSAVGASADQGAHRSHAAKPDQDDERRRRGGSEKWRADQGALHENFPCLTTCGCRKPSTTRWPGLAR